MKNVQMSPLELPYALKSFDPQNLVVASRVLEGNPLGDPSVRHNYCLIPKASGKSFPVIFHLSGYFSTGYSNFTTKTLNKNFVQKIDEGTHQKRFPNAVHVFAEATTWWGGSQFINSAGCGNYSDYILKELYPAVVKLLPIQAKASLTCVMGGSSGGYGALHFISEKKSPFGIAFAASPDSFFEASLLPELFRAAPELNKYKSISEIIKLIEAGEIQEKKSFFTLANSVAMAHCYSPESAVKKGKIQWPIDLLTGEVKPTIWKSWLQKDPVHFLKKKKAHLKGREIFLDVGKYDNFSLQFGARQIAEILKKEKVKHRFTEFSGNHFGLSERKLLFLEDLKSIWKAHE